MGSSLKDKIGDLPDSPGVYLFKDEEDIPIYIGKAKSIINRIKSHFVFTEDNLNSKLILENAKKIDFVLTDSEIEALLLESELIKKYQPKYNIRIKDDKTFPYILITEEEFPRVIVDRVRDVKDLESYRKFYGPFTSVKAIKSTLNFLLKLFPVCSCVKARKKRVRPCWKYQLKKCMAPCVKPIEYKEYLKKIENIELFLEGKKRTIIENFKISMKEAAAKQDFEEAASLRDQIWALEKTIIMQKVISSGSEVSLGVKELKEILDLPKKPMKIEAFDISNLSGTDPTGSLVLFLNGQPLKTGYRRYKIRTVAGANDVAMMGEVIERRYKRLVREKLILPDLIIVDGGIPQLNIANKILTKLKLSIPIIGLAKKFEHIFRPGMFKPIVLSPDSPALFLLQRIRDEAHRFALKYHRLLRKKRMIEKSS